MASQAEDVRQDGCPGPRETPYQPALWFATVILQCASRKETGSWYRMWYRLSGTFPEPGTSVYVDGKQAFPPGPHGGESHRHQGDGVSCVSAFIHPSPIISALYNQRSNKAIPTHPLTDQARCFHRRAPAQAKFSPTGDLPQSRRSCVWQFHIWSSRAP